MATEWPDNEPGDAGPYPVNRLELPQGGSWPTRLAGYAKTIAAAVAGLGSAGILTWLQAAGVTHLPSWGTALISAAAGLLGVLFGPRNKA